MRAPQMRSARARAAASVAPRLSGSAARLSAYGPGRASAVCKVCGLRRITRSRRGAPADRFPPSAAVLASRGTVLVHITGDRVTRSSVAVHFPSTLEPSQRGSWGLLGSETLRVILHRWKFRTVCTDYELLVLVRSPAQTHTYTLCGVEPWMSTCSRFLILALYFSPLVSGANSVGELHGVAF